MVMVTPAMTTRSLHLHNAVRTPLVLLLLRLHLLLVSFSLPASTSAPFSANRPMIAAVLFIPISISSAVTSSSGTQLAPRAQLLVKRLHSRVGCRSSIGTRVRIPTATPSATKSRATPTAAGTVHQVQHGIQRHLRWLVLTQLSIPLTSSSSNSSGHSHRHRFVLLSAAHHSALPIIHFLFSARRSGSTSQ